MEIWYAHLSEDDADGGDRELRGREQGQVGEEGGEEAAKKDGEGSDCDGGEGGEEGRQKARTRDSLQALSKLGELVDGRYRIVSQPPIVIPMRDLEAMYGISAEQFEHAIHEQFRAYRATLQDDRRHLLEKFEIIDMARKVVGVGSVGTRAFIVLLQGRDQNDPLFLQVKEATASVLEDHLPKSRYKQPGERVVQGQRLMQAASDIYLGWTKGVQENRYLYWRQLRDMKGSAVVESMTPPALGLLRAPVRVDARPRARPLRRPDRDHRVPGQERRVRQGDRRLLRALRRPERPRLRGLHRRRPDRPAGSDRRRLTADRSGSPAPARRRGWDKEKALLAGLFLYREDLLDLAPCGGSTSSSEPEPKPHGPRTTVTSSPRGHSLTSSSARSATRSVARTVVSVRSICRITVASTSPSWPGRLIRTTSPSSSRWTAYSIAISRS